MPSVCTFGAPGPLSGRGFPGWFFYFSLGNCLGTIEAFLPLRGLCATPRRERSSSLFLKRSCGGNNETFYEKEDLKLVFIKCGLMEANRKHPLEQWQPFKAPLQER